MDKMRNGTKCDEDKEPWEFKIVNHFEKHHSSFCSLAVLV